MGLRISFTTLSDETIAEALSDPSPAEFLTNRFEAPPVSEGWMSGLLEGKPKSKPDSGTLRFFKPGVRANVEGVCMTLNDSWTGLNYLLTKARGNTWPAHFLLEGGTLLTSEDDESRLRVFRYEELCKVSDMLCKLSHGDLGRHYNADKMTELAIYPKEMWKREDTDGCQFLLDQFDILRRFVSGTTGKDFGCQIRLS